MRSLQQAGRLARRLVLAFLVLPPLLAAPAAAFEIPGLQRDSDAYAQSLRPAAPPTAQGREAADRRVAEAAARNDWAALIPALEARIALGQAGEALWLRLAEAWQRRSPPDGDRALQAAWQAFMDVPAGAPEIPSLLRISDILATTLNRPGLAADAMAAVLERDPGNEAHRQRLAALRRAAGLTVRRIAAEPESDPPRACIEFAGVLSPRRDVVWADWVRADGVPAASVTREEQRLCVAGLAHGRTWRITLRQGLPGEDDVRLARDVTLEIAMPDRAPRVILQSGAFILPRGDAPRMTVGTVNLSAVALKLYRVGERNLGLELGPDGRVLKPLGTWAANELAEGRGTLVWEGTLSIPSWQRNVAARTTLDLAPMLGNAAPGLFALTATAGDGTPVQRWGELATQWLVVTDIGLTALRGADGVTVLARGLGDPRPLEGLRVALISRANDELAAVATDADGVARFPAPLTRGRGGAAPSHVVARAEGGDLAFLDLALAAFDLSDRGVEGRPHPGPLDAWAWTERGIYRAGETVNLLALLRTGAGAVADVPVTVRLRRPNGTIASETVPQRGPGGAIHLALPLAAGAPQGGWTIELLADPAATPIGRASFRVEDFVPDRLAVELAAPGALIPGMPLSVPVTARFLYGAPASGLAASGELLVVPDPNPFPALAGWRFGLVEDAPEPLRTDVAIPDTDSAGRTAAPVLLPRAPDTTRPLRATLSVAVTEPGGRPTRTTVDFPVRSQGPFIGIRPLFEGGAVAANTEAGFEVAAFDAEGRPVAAPRLRLRLVRERPDWRIVLRERIARYETVWRDEPVQATELAVTPGVPARFAATLDWGRYRIEVSDADSLAATSVRFRAGFVPSAGAGDTPDLLDVAADRSLYAPGDAARVRIAAPFAGRATLTVLTDRVHLIRTLEVPEGGVTIEVPVDAAWGPGAYAAVTLLRGRAEAGTGPVRALGLAWLGLDPAPRTLPVAIEAPDLLRPRADATITVRAAPGAQVALAAVDEGILRLTGHASPDPVAHFTGKRRLGIDIRDDYGRLIAPAEGETGLLRQGGDEEGGGAGLPAIPLRIASLFAGPVEAGADGTARFPFSIPDVNTSLRLMAVAWDAARSGAAASSVPVRDPLVAEPALPRFLAPGDEARLLVSLHNVELPAGEVRLSFASTGPVAIDGGTQTVTLAEGGRGRALFTLRGTGAGVSEVSLRAEGPAGFSATRVFPLTVRTARPAVTTVSRRELPPGQTLTVPANALGAYLPGTGRVTLSVNSAAPFDAAALIRALEAWPYACLEQVVSAGLPLVFLEDEAVVGADRVARLQATIGAVLEKQRYDGSFGLWSANDAPEPWLTAYATEFLLRAKRAGATVPDAPLDAALRYLAGTTEDSARRPWQRAAQAYALYALALAGQPRPGAMRVMADQGAALLPSPLARAQLGAALLLSGDRARGEALLRDAAENPARDWSSEDYGSTIRDASAMIVLARETGAVTDRVAALLDRLPADAVQPARTSTQEQAWAVAAAALLGRDGQPAAVTIDGTERPPAPIIAVTRDATSLPVALRNIGTRPIWPGVATMGIPAQPPPAARDGLVIRRNFFRRDGTPLNLDQLRQNEVFVLVLEGRAETRIAHQALLVHGLPAGWEPEAVRLGPGEVPAFPWLGELTRPVYASARDDRLVAQIDLTEREPAFKLAFLVRAVTPGRFELPGAILTDMYKPRFFARQTTGRISIAPAE
ncbi:alpha-2-macroglobulin family protein [Elioraea rosea]|uniref:alpha-2-macroglobulin family protein n=1 Tax=Elioraea rosea TaxID=2492390 RepID=UPI0011825FFE|nr:alpha-2-macroglobulin [Elioraea rosea]